MLSADLQQVSTAAGDGERAHRDGAAVQAQFYVPANLILLPDGRVLVSNQLDIRIRVLGADLQQVSTATSVDELDDVVVGNFGNFNAFALLPDGRLLVGRGNRIFVLEGFPAALLSTKPPTSRPRRRSSNCCCRRRRSAHSPVARARPAWCRSAAARARAAAAAAAAVRRRYCPAATARAEQQGGSAAKAEPLV
jgi:hypothetical protein